MDEVHLMSWLGQQVSRRGRDGIGMVQENGRSILTRFVVELFSHHFPYQCLQEEHHRIVLYEADAELTPWTRCCFRQVRREQQEKMFCA